MRPGLLLRAAVWSVLAVVLSTTRVDPDLWGHVVFGRDMVLGRAIPRTDPYSFTSDRPWINHEWLAESGMYLAYGTAGPRGLAWLRLALIAAALLTAARFVERRIPNVTVGASIVLLLGIAIGSVVLPIRPHLFSVWLFATLLVLLGAAAPGRSRALWIVPPLTALWVNLHGGWVVGIGVFLVWIGWALVDTRRERRERLRLGFLMALTLLATLLNPYGFGLWRFLAETVRLSRPDIVEWQPIASFGPVGVARWSLTALIAAVAFVRLGPRSEPAALTIAAMMGIASFRVARLDAFFSLSVIVLLGPALARSFDFAERRWVGRGTGWGRTGITVAALLVIVIPAINTTARNVSCVPMRESWLPEPEAAAFVRRSQLRGRMLTWFNWGEYAIWHLAPEIRVSMDGRRETVYSERLIRGHWSLYRGDPHALEFVREIDPAFVWLPAELPGRELLLRDGWVPLFVGPVSHILARSAPRPPERVTIASSGDRCFPGP